MTTKLEFKISFRYRLQAIFSFNMFGLAIVRNGLLPLCFRLLLAKYRLSSQDTQVISHISLFTIPFHHYRYIWPSLIFFDKIASAYALFSQTTKLFFFRHALKATRVLTFERAKKDAFLHSESKQGKMHTQAYNWYLYSQNRRLHLWCPSVLHRNEHKLNLTSPSSNNV